MRVRTKQPLAARITWQNGLITQATISSTHGGGAKLIIHGKPLSIQISAMGKQTLNP